MNQNYSPLFTAYIFKLTNLIDNIDRLKDFDWDIKNNIGYTKLYLASAANYETIAYILIRHGADLNAINKKHSTSLYTACFAEHTAVVRLLLENEAVL